MVTAPQPLTLFLSPFSCTEPLLEKRRVVIVGETEVPENETAEGKAALTAEAEVPPGIPDFWATALSNHPELEPRITDKDREVLAYVTDVREEDILDEDGDEIGFKIVFAFSDNPFLTDTELSMRFHMSEENGYLSVRDIEGCDIHWRPEKDVTVKKMRKKPKPGSKSKAPQTKTEPVESFFRWFTDAPEVPDNLDALGGADEEEDEDMEELRDAVEAHMRVGEVLREDVVPNAVKWFTGEALLEMAEGEEEESEEEEWDSEDEDGQGADDDSEDDDDEDDSGDEGGPGGPKDAAQEQPAECKQQ
jgi:nucleosome assembly protein 1-like 1